MDEPRPHAASVHGGVRGERFRRVAEYIDAKLASKITLSELAGVANLSAHHFSEVFRQTTGQSPYRYVQRRRIDRAKELLRETELSILEVALLSGFSDHSHFSKAFHRTVTMTPKQYRLSAS